jgi:hypothetical protein
MTRACPPTTNDDSSMEPSTSSGSSGHTATSSHQDQKTFPDGNFELELEARVPTQIPPPPSKRWYTSIDRRLATNAPRLYRKVMDAVDYVKGPRPRLNLPGSRDSLAGHKSIQLNRGFQSQFHSLTSTYRPKLEPSNSRLRRHSYRLHGRSQDHGF